MPNYTTNLNLTKPTPNEFYDIGVANNNMDLIDAASGSLVEALAKVRSDLGFIETLPTSSQNAKLLSSTTTTEYVTGMKLAFRNNLANTNTTVNVRINSLPTRMIYRADGSNIPIGYLKANTIYHMVYDGTAFFLLGDAVEYGNAAASQVLAPYTIATESGIITGNIPTKSAQTYTPGTLSQVIPASQYLGGNQTILGSSSLTPQNIRYNETIFGVTGNFTEDATVDPSEVMMGKTYYSRGARRVGTAPVITTRAITPGTSNITIPAGSYLTGAQTILGDPLLQAANIPTGLTIFNILGTGPNFASGTGTSSNVEYEFEYAAVGTGRTTFSTKRASVFSLPFTPKVVIVVSRTMNQGIKPTTVYIEGQQFFNGEATPIMATGYTDSAVRRPIYNTGASGNAFVIGTTFRLPLLFANDGTNLQFDWYAFTY